MLGVVLGPIVVAAGASMLDLYVPGAVVRNTKVKPGVNKPDGVLE
jgi:hypothetical protein